MQIYQNYSKFTKIITNFIRSYQG